jgi:hypothetical protein
MEARLNRTARCYQKVVILRVAGHLALLAALLPALMGARQRSANFIVETPDPNFAQQVSLTAERYRHDLAVEWMGQAMPNWSQPCVMTVQVGPHLGAGGATTFMFDSGEVFGWRMSIQGSAERILDSVLPHEITHMIYASHFRQPLPRWADEGGATSVEHASEKNKHRTMLIEFLRTGRGIAFSQMFVMSDYPRDIMPLYAQGYSLAEFLIQTGGRQKYIEFLGDGLQGDDWSGAIQRHYGIRDLSALQNTWLAWVQQGSPALKPREVQPPAAGEMLAANDRRPRPEPNLIYRVRDKQSPATPLGNLVPVSFSSPVNSARAAGDGQTGKAVASVTPVRATTTAIKWVDSSQTTSVPAVRVAVTDPRVEPTVLPTAGWRLAGTPAPTATASPSTPPSNESYSTQVTHPQAVEQPQQTVLR